MTLPTNSSDNNDDDRPRPRILPFRRAQRDRAEVISETVDPGSDISSDPLIETLNKDFALVVLGDTATVMKGQGNAVGFWKVSTFKQWFSNQSFGKKTLAAHWLEHPERRQYEGVTFAPGAAVCPPNHYNLFSGFAVEPQHGDCAKFLNHLRDNVCRGDRELYKWVVGWFAQIFQEPEKKIGTSLVLRGKQGVGKTIVGKIFGSLLGPHYLLVADPTRVTGKFNAHMASLLILQADEAFWAGDHRAEGRLKDLVTGESQIIEYKGKDTIRIPNFLRLFVTGNPDWLVPAALEERRFAVLDVGEDHIQDVRYFAALEREMDSGGREALLDHLLHFDLSTVDLRSIPRTTALLQQKIASLTPEQAWWADVLTRGKLPFGCERAGCCPTETLFGAYIEHAQSQGVRHRVSATALGMLLKKLVPGIQKRGRVAYKIVTARETYINMEGRVYEFPPLRRCRENFENLIQQSIGWDRRLDDWEIDVARA
jgi:hypothetical protein